MKKKTKKSDAPMLHIGADQQSIEAVADAIMRVLATSAGDAVKIAAIQAVQSVATPHHVSVSGCTFSNGSGVRMTAG